MRAHSRCAAPHRHFHRRQRECWRDESGAAGSRFRRRFANGTCSMGPGSASRWAAGRRQTRWFDSAASPAEVRWEPCAESFSTFTYCRAWDHGQCLADISVGAQAQDRSLAPGDLALLRSHFSEGPRTYGHPGVTNYRFFTRNSAILIWDGEDDKWRGGQADWWLMANTEEALLGLLRRVWDCGTLRETLYADDPRMPMTRVRGNCSNG
jgi:hypothetical protein